MGICDLTLLQGGQSNSGNNLVSPPIISTVGGSVNFDLIIIILIILVIMTGFKD
jgi:hypothetical protein